MRTAGAADRFVPRVEQGRSDDDHPLVTVGLAWFALVFLAAGVLLAGDVLTALAVVDASIPVFVVALATSPLFARLPLAWRTRGAAMGVGAGWLLAAPLGALLDAGRGALEGVADADGFFPGMWMWALPSLLVAWMVTALRGWHVKRRRL